MQAEEGFLYCIASGDHVRSYEYYFATAYGCRPRIPKVACFSLSRRTGFMMQCGGARVLSCLLKSGAFPTGRYERSSRTCAKQSRRLLTRGFRSSSTAPFLTTTGTVQAREMACRRAWWGVCPGISPGATQRCSCHPARFAAPDSGCLLAGVLVLRMR